MLLGRTCGDADGNGFTCFFFFLGGEGDSCFLAVNYMYCFWGKTLQLALLACFGRLFQKQIMSVVQG